MSHNHTPAPVRESAMRLTCLTCSGVSGRALPYDLTQPDACDHCGAGFGGEVEPPAPVFRLQTADPRFDPLKPLMVNGFTYRPHKEASGQWN
ncbi:MAG: hypothetical protein WKF79_00125 [Nocardioides sp.]